jgi:hypothetical protein
MNVRCLRHRAACAWFTTSRPIILSMRRAGRALAPGSGAEVGGDRGIHDGAPGGWVNAVGTACSARAKVALGDR